MKAVLQPSFLNVLKNYAVRKPTEQRGELEGVKTRLELDRRRKR